MLTIKKLTKAHAGRTLFYETELIVNWGERIALVGPNGAGKSTLFRMILGEDTPDEGQIIMDEYGVVGYLPQEAGDPSDRTVLEIAMSITPEMGQAIRTIHLCDAKGDNTSDEYAHAMDIFIANNGYQIEPKAKRILKGLAFKDEDFHRPAREMSGGWVMRAHLAQLLVAEPDLLMLDEPTNHLDLQATEWLEEYLRKFRGTVVTISHDRYFLDRTVSRIIEIENGQAEFYSGNYSFYAVEKERRYQERMKQYLKEQAKIKQLEEAIERTRLWAFMGNDDLYKRAFSMEKRIERMRTTAKPTKGRKMDARFASREFHGDEILQIKGLTKSFDERTLFSDIYLRIEGGERIALVGENGTGKTTLLNILTGREDADRGNVKVGPSVRSAYLEQIIHFDDPNRNLVDTMLYAKKNLSTQSARNRLASYQFRGEDVFKSVSVLSGGEMSRLRLCMLMDEEINFLILDEPTNHLDIDSREWIEEAVEAFDGTLLFVSHDRYFINRFATRVWELADGTITDYPMGFAQYRSVKEAEAREKPVVTTAPEKKGDTRVRSENRNQRAARRQLTICETAIGKLEKAIAALDEEMEQYACDAVKLGELFQQKQETEELLEQEMLRWEELSLVLEENEV